MENLLFYLLSSIAVVAALAVVASRRPTYGALALMACFCAVAGLFGMLGASFLAAVQIIVYAGAVLVVFLLVIMLLDLRGETPSLESKGLVGWAGLIGGVVLFGLLWRVIRQIPATDSIEGQSGTAAALGQYLFTAYLLPFEASAILILVTLVGASWLARR